jgi:TolA-binding protein
MSLATLKNELAEEKLAREKAQIDAKTLSQEVEEGKKIIDQHTAQVPFLEAQVKNLNDKITELNIELRAREQNLEQTATARDDFQHQSTRLTKKIEGKYSSSLLLESYTLIYSLLTPRLSCRNRSGTVCLKAMVENAVTFFYLDDPVSVARAPVLLDGLSTRS